ncbi:MAG TPA: chorismate lyase [Rhodocyclaceae bacterium]|nr:chorismate lyase [Rhodocyclaceae bacterium]HRQ47551.1 chorismate lyase [Rhodocyclaceae bacterium]
MQARPLLARWRARPSRAGTPSELRPWLTDRGSLTARIRARCGRFSVSVLRQTLGRAHPDEAALFGLRWGERVWVREVLLVADGVPVVFARSVLPFRNVRGAWNLFHGIGSRPLGAALFADPRIERMPLNSSCLDRRDARYHRAIEASGMVDSPQRLWARRSVFRLRRRALLVTEVFLPAIARLSECPRLPST